MANFAALIDVLSIAGSRLSTGAVNASGQIWFFQPGTNTAVDVYSDAAATAIVTQPITLTAGGLLNTTDLPNGIYVTQPVRIYIEDVDGDSVSDTTYVPATAGDVGVDNDGFTDSTLDDVLTDAYTSFGGVDWTYKESGGATSRTVKAKFAEIWISVKDFGAVGDGIAIDTTAIQAAMSRAKVLSSASGVTGATVWFPPGVYVIDQALTLSSATGVTLRGGGAGSTQIWSTNGTANGFTFTSCSTFELSGLRLLPPDTTGSTGVGISLVNCSSVHVADMVLDNNNGGLFLCALKALGSGGISSSIHIDRCSLTGTDSATGRGIWLASTTFVYIRSTAAGSGSTGGAVDLELSGSTGSVFIEATSFISADTGIKFTSGLTGQYFTIVGCPLLGSGTFTKAIDLSALSTDPILRQWGNGVDGYATTVTTGATVTPDRSRGPHIRITGTTTGSAYTVAVPTPAPATSMSDVYLRLSLTCGAGGAITGWGMAAGYHVTAPSTTDGQTTSYTLLWDPAASVWREFSRSVTT
jgi:hypothetical protein